MRTRPLLTASFGKIDVDEKNVIKCNYRCFLSDTEQPTPLHTDTHTRIRHLFTTVQSCSSYGFCEKSFSLFRSSLAVDEVLHAGNLMWEVRYPAHVSHRGDGRAGQAAGEAAGSVGMAVAVVVVVIRCASRATHSGTRGQGRVSQCVHSCAAPPPLIARAGFCQTIRFCCVHPPVQEERSASRWRHEWEAEYRSVFVARRHNGASFLCFL